MIIAAAPLCEASLDSAAGSCPERKGESSVAGADGREHLAGWVERTRTRAASRASRLFLNFRNFACQQTQISSLIRTVPSLRDVTVVGRDAVDAAAPLTNGAGAYGEVVWF